MRRFKKRFDQLLGDDRRALSGGLIGTAVGVLFFLFTINLVDLETRITISLWAPGLCALVGAIGGPARADELKALGRGALLGAMMSTGLVLAAPTAALSAVAVFSIHATDPWWFLIHGVLIGALSDLILTLRFGAAGSHDWSEGEAAPPKTKRAEERDTQRRSGRNTA